MVQNKKTHIAGRKISYTIASIITIVFLFNISAEAQPLSKRIEGFTVKETIKRVVIPFNYSNYKKVGPPTREIYFPNQKAKDLKKPGVAPKGKVMEVANSFLNAKRHMASLETNNQSTLPEKRNPVSFFLNEKRHL